MKTNATSCCINDLNKLIKKKKKEVNWSFIGYIWRLMMERKDQYKTAGEPRVGHADTSSYLKEVVYGRSQAMEMEEC